MERNRRILACGTVDELLGLVQQEGDSFNEVGRPAPRLPSQGMGGLGGAAGGREGDGAFTDHLPAGLEVALA